MSKADVVIGMPEDCKELCVPGFSMIPIGKKVFVEPIPLKDIVTPSGILLMEAQGQQNPGGTSTLCTLLSIGREAHAECPYLKPGDKIYVNQLTGSSLKLYFNGKHTMIFSTFTINLEGNYYGDMAAYSGENPLKQEGGMVATMTQA